MLLSFVCLCVVLALYELDDVLSDLHAEFSFSRSSREGNVGVG